MKLNNIFLTLAAVIVCSIPGLSGSALAQVGAARFENERWSRVGDVVVITYDLMGSPEETYDVSLVLRRQNDRSFSFVPTVLAGNVGKDQSVGSGKEIRWDYKKDLPSGLSGDDYWFELTAVKIEKGGGVPWWVYAAGGAGVAVAVAVLGGGKGGDTSPPQSTTLPGPPNERP